MTAYHEFHNGTFRVHEARRCFGEPCALHNPSNHEMAHWPMEWVEFLSLPVRLCPHGFQHPDPDGLHYIHGATVCVDPDCGYRSHYCDGCCRPYYPVAEILADLIAIAESIK